MDGRIVVVIGCTGSGKGEVAHELALRTGGEIVSLDAMKVYRRMDIGTAKPSAARRGEVAYHLLDVVEPWEEFSVARYIELADAAIAEIRGRGKPIFVCGGTALYLKALTDGLFEGPGANTTIRERLHATAAERGSPVLHEELRRVDVRAAERIHPNDLKRIVRALEVHELTGKPISELQAQWDCGRTRWDAVILGLRRPIEDQNRRTNQRVHRMIEAGLVDEVRALLAEPRPLSPTAGQALGYAEMIRHLSGELSLDQAVEAIKINTRQFAKSQRTWFRRIRTIEWIELGPDSSASRIVDELLERRGSSCFTSPN